MRGLATVVVLGAALGLAGCFEPATGPFAVFSLDPTSGPSPLVVRFDASASYAPGGQIVDYRWDFGDGETGTGRTPIHTYRTEKRRVLAVTLTVIDHRASRASTTLSVTVLPPEAAPTEAEVSFVWPFHFDALGDDAANLNDEYFTLENHGTLVADLSGWSVSNERGETFRFPAGFMLAPGTSVAVHSGSGEDTPRILHWNAIDPVWNDRSDIAILYNATGEIVDVYAYASC